MSLQNSFRHLARDFSKQKELSGFVKPFNEEPVDAPNNLHTTIDLQSNDELKEKYNNLHLL